MSERTIKSKGLKAGDILFKHASSGTVSQIIKAGQKVHFWTLRGLLARAPARTSGRAEEEGRTVADRRDPSPAPQVSAEEASDITHVALALGPDDVVEFDEGGASYGQIIREQGFGFVRDSMNIPSRKGKRYEVYRCRHEGLWSRAADKAALVWDLTHASPNPAAAGIQGRTPLTGSYGVVKMAGTGLGKDKIKGQVQEWFGKKPDVSPGYFEKTLDTWLKAADKKNAGLRSNTNIQFFCSGFVMFCYLWAAAEWQENGEIAGLDYALGKKTNVPPVEVYARIKTEGGRFFEYAGTLEN